MEGVHYTRHIAQQGKHEIEPKLAAQTDDTKYTERWQYSGKDHLHGTRNHGSHGALLSECRHRMSGLVPGSCTGFPFAQSANSIPQRSTAPGSAPMESRKSVSLTWPRSTLPVSAVCTVRKEH